jgi:predicted small integral membrane protein
MVRIAKIVLVLAVAFYGAMGIFNLLGWEAGLASVRTITSMADVPEGRTMPWATDNPVIVTLGLLFIAGSKISGGVLCALGAWKMWVARNAPAEVFNASKDLAVLGCVVLLVMFFGGFIYLAAQFFGGFRTEMGRGSAGWASQLGASVAFILLFLNQPDR